jgi:hypothetical protein
VQDGPQVTDPPQPLEMVPQLAPPSQPVIGVQPQTLAVPPPPQVCGSVHAGPQLTWPPQLSETVPQLSPAGQVVSGVHGTTTVTWAVAACTADGALPMTMNVVVESAALAVADKVSVELAPAVTEAGLNAAVTPLGKSCA